MLRAVGAVNSNNIGLQELEVMRRLQSLGIRPTGNILTDRQLLQKAEYQKRQLTLTDKVQSLNNLKGSGLEFADALNGLSTQSTNTSTTTYNSEYAKTGATQLANLYKYQLGL